MVLYCKYYFLILQFDISTLDCFVKKDPQMNRFLLILLVLISFQVVTMAQPPCNQEIAEPTYNCPDAPIVCDLNYFCSTMPVSISPQSASICNAGISLDNPHWFSFIATSNTVTVTINPTNCLAGGGGQLGLQGAIVSSCPPPPGGGQFQTVGNCQAIPCATFEFTIGAGGNFNVGQQYWIMLDGCAGSICDYQITNTQGITVPVLENPNEITGPFQTCPGGTVTFTVDDPDFATTFYWTIDGTVVTSLGPELEYTFPSGTPEGTYEICLENAENACYDLIETNGYVANSICFEIEVLNLPETDAGPVDVCVEDAPYERDGFSFNPPSTNQQYTLETSAGCDSIINLTINWIQHFPDDQILVTCEGEFPVVHPIFGNIFEPGTVFVNYSDQQYGCDSSFNVTVNEMIFQFDLDIPRYDLQCPDEMIEIDASQSRVIILPSNLELFNVDYEWFRNGVPIGNGVYMTIFEGGDYVFRMTATEMGVTCFQDFEFTIEEFFDIPDAPVIVGPSAGCIGNIVSFDITNWNGESEITFIHGTCYDIVSINGPTLTVQLTEACNDVFCVILNKPNCPLLSSEACFNFTIAAQLDPGVTGNLSYCEGLNTTLTAGSGFTSYNWTGPNSFSSNQRIITAVEPGDYTVEVTDANGCEGTQTVTVVENPTPPISFSGSTAFCPGGRSTITVSPGSYASYTWSNGLTGPQAIFTVPNIYQVTVVDAFGCINTAQIEIFQRDTLEPNIGGDLDFCAGLSTTLDGGVGFATYEWNGTMGNQTIVINTPGEVILRVSDGSGCFGSTRTTVVENPNPVASIDAPKMMICPAEDLVLQVNPAGMTRYEWSDGFTGRTRTINDVVNFEVTVTDGNGCIGTSSISIGVHTPPSPQVAGDTYFCEGLQALIGVVDPYTTYRWSDNNTNQTRPVNTAGRYSVTVTDGNGCTGETFYDVEERMNPRPVIQGDDEFCAGGSTVLTLTQPYSSYTWSGSGSGSSANYPVTTSGNYIVQVTDASGCIGSTNFVVTVHPNPVPQIAGSTTYCVGLSTTLDAGNYVSFNWAGPGGFSRTTRTVSINAPGNYSVTVTDVNGCIGTSSVTVIEDTELSIGVDNPGRYCEGSTARISVQGTYASYRWSTGATTQAINVTAGTYTVTATDSDGCTGSQTVVVTEDPNPVPVISGPSTFCTGRSAQLDAGAWTSYAWSNGLGNGRTVTISATGTYTVTVTDANGCQGTASFFIRELASLEPQINGDPFYCAGSSATLTVEAGYQRYTWLDNNSTNPQRVFTSPGIFTIEVEDAQGCTGTGQVTVVENPLPIADAGADVELTCRDTALTVGGTNTSAGSFSYSWTELENGVPVTGTNRTLRVTEVGLYELRVVNTQTGCVQTDQVRVTRNTNIITDVVLNAVNPRCHNDVNGRITISQIVGGTEPYSYQINGNAMSGGIAGSLGPGVYRIRVEDANGCTFEVSATLINPERVVVDAGPDLLLNYGDDVTIVPETNIPENQRAVIKWEEGDVVLCDGCPGIELYTEPQIANVYRITIEDIFGCVATDIMRINLKRSRNVFVPSAFTPDLNGLNDKFTVYGGRDVVNIKSLQVFDRWGNKMFEAEDLPPNDTNYGWDGTFRGREMDPAVFVYVAEVEFIDGEVFEFIGDVALIK
jgi:gliding motility-associated-like protein